MDNTENLTTHSEAKRSFVQLIKFAIVGVMNTLVSFLVFSALVLLFHVDKNDWFLTAVCEFIGFACGVLNSFILNSHWTFKTEYKRTNREKWVFIAVNAVSYAVSILMIFIFSKYVFEGSGIVNGAARIVKFTTEDEIAQLVKIFAKALAAPVVIIVNFIGSKLLVFTGKKGDAQ